MKNMGIIKIDKNFYFFKKNKMNEFIFLSLENIDDILIFSQVCKKWNEIYKKWKNEWYTIHTQIVFSVDENGYKKETKIIGNRQYITVWYMGGNKKYEGEYKDGKEEGKWIGWYWNDTIQYEKEYEDGKEEGKWFGWYWNGNKMYEGEYKDGKKEGKWIGWHDDGVKEFEVEFKEGKWIEW